MEARLRQRERVMSLYSSKAVHMRFSTGGYMHSGLPLPEDFRNRLPDLGAYIVLEETTPPPLPVSFPTDSVIKLP